MRDEKPIIGLTMGDPAGVGPEIIVKALSREEIYDICRPMVFGEMNSLGDGLKITKLDLEFNIIKNPSEAKFIFRSIDLINFNNVNKRTLIMGKPQSQGGRASFEYIVEAIESAKKGEIDAVTTAPISKEALKLAGYDYPGHTEIFANLLNCKSYAMMLSTENLRVVHVSTHVSLKEAISKVKADRVLEVIRLAYGGLNKLGVQNPRIAVSGLNPHAGEGGLFGEEEDKEITPAVREALREGLEIYGPLPADTVFYRALRGDFDVIVVMYHDQGHIPVKLYGFERGVNVTLGLPIIRTSVDHGTAYGRAGKRLGTADPTSIVEAIKMAVQLSGSTPHI